MEFAVKTEYVLAPEPFHELDLLGEASPLTRKIDTKSVVFHLVPPDTQAERQPILRQDGDFGGLFRHQGCLALRGNENRCHQLCTGGARSEETKRHQRLMKLGVGVVGALEPTWPVTTSPEHMVIEKQVPSTEFFGPLREGAHGPRVRSDFVMGDDDAEFHEVRLADRCAVTTTRTSRHHRRTVTRTHVLSVRSLRTMTGTLVILRHGQSVWNEANLFTGWHDVELTERGRAEATAAGHALAAEGLRFDTSHTSLLTRAVVTQNLALEALGQPWLPVERHWRLNERHYGALQGLDKVETTQRHGPEQTYLWRRGFDTPPPPVDTASEEHPLNDPRYRHLPPEVLPAAECLRDVVARVMPYWHDRIAPQLLAGLDVLVTAHGNSLRALLMHLEGVSSEAIAEVNIPTGVPRRYTFDSALVVIEATYLGDPDVIAAAEAEVAGQAGTH